MSRELFAMVPESLWKQMPARWRVLAYILQDSNGSGLWFGKQGDIAKATGLAVATVRSALADMEKSKHVETRATTDSNGYNGFKVYAVKVAVGDNVDAALDRFAVEHRLNVVAGRRDRAEPSRASEESEAPGGQDRAEPSRADRAEPSRAIRNLEVVDRDAEDLEEHGIDASADRVIVSSVSTSMHADEVEEADEPDAIATPMSDEDVQLFCRERVRHGKAYKHRIEPVLRRTGLAAQNRVHTVAGWLAFVWFADLGIYDQLDEAELLDLVDDPATARWDDEWLCAIGELACLDELGAPGHDAWELRVEFMGVQAPSSWTLDLARQWHYRSRCADRIDLDPGDDGDSDVAVMQ